MRDGAFGRLQAPQLRHRRRVRGVSALARAAVEVGYPFVAAVEDERVAGADHRPAAWRPDVRPVLAREAEDEHALLVELELGQRAVGEPVARLDHELGHGPVAGKMQQRGVVARVEVGPPLEAQLDQSGQVAVDPAA